MSRVHTRRSAQKALLCGLVITLQPVSCETLDTSPLKITNPNLRYFGFILVDVGWDDPSDLTPKTNYTDEVANFSNVADVLAHSPVQNIQANLINLQTQGLKAIVHINDLFFEQTSTGTAPSGRNFDLRPDYQTRWDTFCSTNSLAQQLPAIQAWYLGEEPSWNGIEYAELQTAADYIKASIAAAPILIVEAYPVIDRLQVPSSVDWLGFDHYFIREPQNDEGFRQELQRLKDKRSRPNQSLVLIMDSHYIFSRHGAQGIQPHDLRGIALSYFSLANQDPAIIGILGYFWPSGFDDPASVGARNLPPAVKNEYTRIGKAISQK